MIEFRIKEKTRSLNESFRGDWRPRAAVAKRQRTKAMQACPKWPGGPLLVVRLTRVSPGTLDSDAVPAACKHIRDGLAARLRIDDASPLIAWEYHQAKGEAEVVVQIWTSTEEGPVLPVGRLAPGAGESVGTKVKPKRQRCSRYGCKKLLPCAEHSHPLLRIEPEPGSVRAPRTRRSVPFNEAMDAVRAERGWKTTANYTPPRSKAADAAKEAEATFAPAPCTTSSPCGHCMDCIGTLP